MTWTIPASTPYSLQRGANSVVVWSLQKALNASAIVVPDGDFGPVTEKAVRDFQEAHGLTVDGVAGPATQRTLSSLIVGSTQTKERTPSGLLTGFAEGEGGWLLGAVNHSVAGGVDCGLFQRRVYSADSQDSLVIERAFDTAYQADLLAKSLINLRGIFIARAGTNDGSLPAAEKAWRLAALNHNYPSAADTLSRTPMKSLSSYWTSPQSWVTAYGFKFPDGAAVRTPLDWSHLYAGVLGNAHDTKGSVTRLVTYWP